MDLLRAKLGLLPHPNTCDLVGGVRSGVRRTERASGLARGLLAPLAVLSVLALCSVAKAQSNEPKRVLILLENDVSWPIFPLVDESLRATLRNGSPRGILIFSEHLDRGQFPDLAIQTAQEDLIKMKYANSKIDLVGKDSILHEGGLRADPHIERKLDAAEAIEAKRTPNPGP
jgi:hypothetical protein